MVLMLLRALSDSHLGRVNLNLWQMKLYFPDVWAIEEVQAIVSSILPTHLNLDQNAQFRMYENKRSRWLRAVLAPSIETRYCRLAREKDPESEFREKLILVYHVVYLRRNLDTSVIATPISCHSGNPFQKWVSTPESFPP